MATHAPLLSTTYAGTKALIVVTLQVEVGPKASKRVTPVVLSWSLHKFVTRGPPCGLVLSPAGGPEILGHQLPKLFMSHLGPVHGHARLIVHGTDL